MRKLFLVSVECDLRMDDVAVRQAGLDALLAVFADAGLAGHVTWFVNESDFRPTELHEGFLHEVVARGDMLGIHDHLECFRAKSADVSLDYDARSVLAYCAAAHERLSSWLDAHGYDARVTAHRNGCLAQAPQIYEALAELGYTVLSDVWPRHRGTDRRGRPAHDNTGIPLGIGPYRHDTANFQDHTSRIGQFLQVPVAEMFLGPFRFELLQRWFDASEQQGVDPAVFTWCLHPYEVINDAHDAASPGMVGVLRDHLVRCREEHGVEFASMGELEGILAEGLT